jgi:hypothetical protein
MALQADGIHPAGKRVQLRARHFVIAGGAIGSPALLLRSGVPDPYRLLGKRTFLHPVVISSALMPERVDAYAGAPQSIYSDHFLHRRRSTVRSASSSKRRRCTRCSLRRRCRALARRTPG